MRSRINSTTILLSLIFLWSAYFVHSWPTFYESNQYLRLHQAEALVDFQSFSVNETMERYGVYNEDVALYKGKAYCDKAIGHPLIGTLVYAIFKPLIPDLPPDKWIYLLTLMVNTLSHLVGVYALFRICRILNATPASSLAASAVYGLCTPGLLYSSLYFGHQLAASSGIVALWLLLRWEPGENTKPRYQMASMALAGFLTAQMVAVEYSALWIGVCLSFFALNKIRNPMGIGLFILCALPWTLGVLVHNWWVFDHPLSTGYQYKFHGAGLTIGKFEGTLSGFRLPSLLDYARQLILPTRGLFFWCPVLLLSIPGLFLLSKGARNSRDTGFLCGAIVVGHASLIAAFVDWTAGYTASPRTLLVMLPFFCLGLVPILDSQEKKLREFVRWCFVPLAAISFIHVAAVSATFPFHAPVFDNPIYALSWPLLIDGHLARNWGQALFGFSGINSLIPILVCTLVGMGMIIWSGTWKLPQKASAVVAAAWLGLTLIFLLSGVSFNPPQVTQQSASQTAEILSLMEYPEAAQEYRRISKVAPEAPTP